MSSLMNITQVEYLKWQEIQTKIASEVREEPFDISTIRTIGGLDISYAVEDESCAIVSYIICSWPDMAVVYEKSYPITITIPYTSGYLGFREVPHYINAIRAAEAEGIPKPEVCLIDGFGQFHSRGAGSASHLGVIENIRTIGVAKKIAKKYAKHVGIIEDDAKCCYALASSDTTKRMIYVSVGHKITLDVATEIVKICCISRIPEPIRQADLRSREMLKSAPEAMRLAK